MEHSDVRAALRLIARLRRWFFGPTPEEWREDGRHWAEELMESGVSPRQVRYILDTCSWDWDEFDQGAAAAADARAKEMKQ